MKRKQFKDPRTRKMLLVLPLLIIPFLTMAFWSLGGGQGDEPLQKQPAGLNLQLPNAQLKDEKDANKLSFYEEAEKDSAKWRQGVESDLSYQILDTAYGQQGGYSPYPLQSGKYKDPNEKKVYQKLAELNRHLQGGEVERNYIQKTPSTFLNGENQVDVNRLEQMIRGTNGPAFKDPEVDQLNGMMDRILDIQHPERVKQRVTENPEAKDMVYPVETKTTTYSISLLGGSREEQINSFYGVDGRSVDTGPHAIEAVIHENQSLVDGSIVKMRLLDDVIISGQTISKGSFVFGIASLDGERLRIEISSLRKGNLLFPVRLSVFDLDGIKGVHIPGAITRDVAKESAGHSLQDIGLSSLDPSLKAQATAAGISAAKALLTKKVRLVKITVKAGYNILLKEKTNQ